MGLGPCGLEREAGRGLGLGACLRPRRLDRTRRRGAGVNTSAARALVPLFEVENCGRRLEQSSDERADEALSTINLVLAGPKEGSHPLVNLLKHPCQSIRNHKVVNGSRRDDGLHQDESPRPLDETPLPSWDKVPDLIQHWLPICPG